MDSQIGGLSTHEQLILINNLNMAYRRPSLFILLKLCYGCEIRSVRYLSFEPCSLLHGVLGASEALHHERAIKFHQFNKSIFPPRDQLFIRAIRPRNLKH